MKHTFYSGHMKERLIQRASDGGLRVCISRAGNTICTDTAARGITGFCTKRAVAADVARCYGFLVAPLRRARLRAAGSSGFFLEAAAR